MVGIDNRLMESVKVNSYKTITSVSQGLYKEKGSKFISFAYPVRDESQVKTIVAGLKREYYDARHHCYAYRLGAEGGKSRVVDDGEPSSTAGKPILGQLLSNELTNVLVVVVRYFGGTKLGVSGLIQAYKEAAGCAIQNGEIITKNVEAVFEITFGYLEMNSVMKVIKETSAEISDQHFDNACQMRIRVRKECEDQLLSKLGDLSGLNSRFIEYN